MDKNLLHSSLSVLPSLYAGRKIYHYYILGLFLASISSMNLHTLLLGVNHSLINKTVFVDNHVHLLVDNKTRIRP